jgi:predicted metal-dependent phosphoesterase TrpH
MIDLHTHTNESDGTVPPARLVEAALALRLEALGICDHDTFAGYDAAVGPAAQAGLDLVCGIELSTKRQAPGERSQSIHMLGYFLDRPPSAEFRGWLDGLQRSRRDRNRRLAERLQSLGMDIRLEDVVKLGRSLAGRPHFAKLMLSKGYVSSIQEAFDRYLAESAEAYVEREEPSLQEGIRRILDGGGLPSLAHPVRLSRRPERIEELVEEMCGMGLRAIEVYHSDHSPTDVVLYQVLARRYDLAITGGTDFHGETKPGLALATGYGNVAVPRELLDNLRAACVSGAGL